MIRMDARFPVATVIAILLALPVRAGTAPDEHAGRRAAMLGLLDSSSALVLRSGETQMRNPEANFRFRQESHLLYLTGEDKPGVSLLLAPRGVRVGDTVVQVVLFAKKGEAEGVPAPRPLPDGIITDQQQFAAVLASLLPQLKTLYASSMSPAFVNDWLNNKPLFLERESRKEVERKFPDLKVKSAGALVAKGRVRKSPWEIERIREAIDATGEGLKRAITICTPGIWEYELQAAIEYEMMRRGARAPAFQSIIGSGPNALILHYEYNRRRMVAGDLVVMDVGAELEGYAADVTRTIPVSGRFTPEQRKVYNAVLRARDSVVAKIKAGMPWPDMDRIAKGILVGEGFGRFWRHSISHHLGIDVHDVGVMDTLRAGMVVTVEPGLYIPVNDTTVTPAYRGIGVRIEDDVLVTESGCEVLSAQIPRNPDQIEKLMRRGKQ